MKKCIQLFLTLFKIGLFTFGGGYAMIALLESELIEKKAWIGKEEFTNMVAIAESTPGPIAINAATYVGFRRGGIPGALCATLGVTLPSFIIIFIISLFFDAFLSLTYVAYAFRGIQVCVIYLILSAGIKMMKGLEKTPFNMILLSLTVTCMLVLSLLAVSFSSVFYILIGGGVGVFVYLLRLLSKKRRKEESDRDPS